jgi:hypothetical protein
MGGTSETDHLTLDCLHGARSVGGCSCSSAFIGESYACGSDDAGCSRRFKHTCPVGKGEKWVPLLLEDAARGNKMQVDEALALPSPRWPVCRAEHPEGAMNIGLTPDGQEFSASPAVLKDSPNFRKLVYFGSRNIVAGRS